MSVEILKIKIFGQIFKVNGYTPREVNSYGEELVPIYVFKGFS